MMNYQIIDTHISDIKVGDTVEHNGKVMTVSAGDIRSDPFFKNILFGDCYRLGYAPVKKVQITHPAGPRQIGRAA